MKKKGFSIMEVVISVSLIGLIIATLGLSFLAVERLRLNAQIRAEIQRGGETILDYLSTLPPTDSYIYSVIPNSPINNILSLGDLDQPNSANALNILRSTNQILLNYFRNLKYEVTDNPDQNIRSKKGVIISFLNNQNQNNNRSRVTLTRTTNNIYTITVELYYISPNRRSRVIRVSRMIVF